MSVHFHEKNSQINWHLWFNVLWRSFQTRKSIFRKFEIWYVCTASCPDKRKVACFYRGLCGRLESFSCYTLDRQSHKVSTMHQHRSRRLFINFASKWIKNKKLEFKAQKLDDKTGQSLFARLLNKNLTEEQDGTLGTWVINDKKGRPRPLPPAALTRQRPRWLCSCTGCTLL